MKKSDVLGSVVQICIDGVMLYCAAFFAYFLRLSDRIEGIRPVEFSLSQSEFFYTATIGVGVVLGVMVIMGMYALKNRWGVFREIGMVIFSVTLGMMAVVVGLFFQLEWFDSRFIFLVSWVMGIVLVISARMIVRIVKRILLYQYGIGKNNVLFIGDLADVAHSRSALIQRQGKGVSIVGTVSSVRLDQIEKIHTEHTLHTIIVASVSRNRNDMMQLLHFCEINSIQFSYTPDTFDSLLADMETDVTQGVAFLSVHHTRLSGWGMVLKRMIDIVVSFVLLVVLSPFLLIIAFLIKWESNGPAVVRLLRVSKGNLFYLYKFRSMVNDSEHLKKYLHNRNERIDGPLFKIQNDPRVTKTGTVLRRYHIDELLELVNVLKGDMSLVGPRPHEPSEIEQYSFSQRKRLAVKAGMTGVAQVNGSHTLSFEEECAMDRYYIENWSLRLDITILFKTALVVLFHARGV